MGSCLFRLFKVKLEGLKTYYIHNWTKSDAKTEFIGHFFPGWYSYITIFYLHILCHTFGCYFLKYFPLWARPPSMISLYCLHHIRIPKERWPSSFCRILPNMRSFSKLATLLLKRQNSLPNWINNLKRFVYYHLVVTLATHVLSHSDSFKALILLSVTSSTLFVYHQLMHGKKKQTSHSI